MGECPPPVPAVSIGDTLPGDALRCPPARGVTSTREGGTADEAAEWTQILFT